jgi:hypothetical protein
MPQTLHRFFPDRLGTLSILCSLGTLGAALLLGVGSLVVWRLHLDGGVLILPWADLLRLLICPAVLLLAAGSVITTLIAGRGNRLAQLCLAGVAILLVPVTFALTNVISRANLHSRLPPGWEWWTGGF